MCDRSSGHDQPDVEWFRVAQRAIQLLDVNHARKADDVYKEHQMDLEDWAINMQGVAVLQPVADGTQYLQGTKYPTLPLVLPTAHGLIEAMARSAPLVLNFPGKVAYELSPDIRCTPESSLHVLKCTTSRFCVGSLPLHPI